MIVVYIAVSGYTSHLFLESIVLKILSPHTAYFSKNLPEMTGMMALQRIDSCRKY